MWDVETGEELAELAGHDGKVRSVAFGPGGTEIVSGSEDMTVRLDAVLALGKIKSQRAVMALIPLLRNAHSAVVRYIAATSLGEIGDPRAVMQLIEALKDGDTTGGVQVAPKNYGHDSDIQNNHSCQHNRD